MSDDARAHLAAVDPVLHAATAHLTPRPLSRRRDPYVSLMRAIVGQQLSTKAAATIWGRFEDRFGERPDGEVVIATSDDDLRALGLSYRKASYVKAVAAAAHEGRLDDARLAAMSDEAIVEDLTDIRGVGRWTVEMLLIFALQRPDVFSPGDLGLRQAVARIHGLDLEGRALEREAARLAEAWAPHRTFASRLLWTWLDGA